jgi:hypothetical protein
MAGASAALPVAREGDQTLVLAFERLGAGQGFAVTMDPAARLGARGVTVAGAETDGALLHVRRRQSCKPR